MRRIRRVRVWAGRGERGTSAIEFVLVFPFILLLVFVLAEGTLILRTWTVLEHASREGARYGATYPQKSVGEVETRTRDRAGSLAPLNVAVTFTDDSISDPFVTVEVTHTYNIQFAYIPNFLKRSFPSLSMGARTHMRLE